MSLVRARFATAGKVVAGGVGSAAQRWAQGEDLRWGTLAWMDLVPKLAGRADLEAVLHAAGLDRPITVLIEQRSVPLSGCSEGGVSFPAQSTHFSRPSSCARPTPSVSR